MADNIKVTEGSGPKVATDEITIDGASAHVQRVKPVVGAAGSGADVSSANPMPVGDSALKGLLESGLQVSDAEALGVLEGILAALAATIKVGDGSGALTVDGSVAVSSLPALVAGTATIGKLGANSGVDIGDVDVTSISAGSNLIGDVGLRPRTSGGLTPYSSLDLDETEEQVKGTAGQVYWYHYANRTAEELFLKFWDATEASVTVGTTPAKFVIPLPRESSGHAPIPQGFAFGTAITIACVKGVATASNTGPAENGCVVTIGYA